MTMEFNNTKINKRKVFIIYLTYNKVNGKIYIGQHLLRSKTTLDRWYMGSGKAIQEAIQKYGLDSFERVILEYCQNQEEANQRERFWIRKYNPEYNILDGGHGSRWTEQYRINHPEEYLEHRRKMSERMRGEKHHMYGKHHSPESIAKISQARKGIPAWNKGFKGVITLSDEHKAKISKALRGKPKPPFSEEHRRNIGLASKGRMVGNKYRLGLAPPNKGISIYPEKQIFADMQEGLSYTKIQAKYYVKSPATLTRIKRKFENMGELKEKYGEA